MSTDPTKLGIGVGLAQGANSFIESFQRARMMKHQQKLQENEPIIRAIQQVLGDDTTPYALKADLLDSLPKLASGKDLKGPSLSEQTGLRKLLREKIITDEGQAATQTKPSVEGTNPQAIINPHDPNGMSATLKGTEATPEIPGQQYIAPTSISRGDMSPLQYKVMAQAKLAKDLEETRNKNDIEKIKATYQAQHDILNKGGFTTKIFEGYDENKDYLIGFTNGEETKTINLGKVTPAAIRKAEITAGGSDSSSKLGQLTRANTVIQEYSLDPSSHTEAEFNAAKGLVDHFEKTGQLMDATITSLGQKTSGTTPITPAQSADDIARDNKTRLDLETAHDTIEAQAIEASANSANAAQTRTDYYNNHIQPIKDRITELLNAGKEKSDAEVITQQKLLASAEKEYTSLDSTAKTAKSKDEALRVKLQSAKDRLNKFHSSSSVSQIGPTAKAFVDKYFGGDLQKAQKAYREKYGKELDVTK